MAAKPKWLPANKDEQRVYERKVLDEAIEKDRLADAHADDDNPGDETPPEA